LPPVDRGGAVDDVGGSREPLLYDHSPGRWPGPGRATARSRSNSTQPSDAALRGLLQTIGARRPASRS
jgi:hypothetical protein